MSIGSLEKFIKNEEQKYKGQPGFTKKILEIEQSIQGRKSALKENFAELKTVLQPQNFIENILISISKKPGLKTLLIKSALGVAVGYFAKMSMEFSMKSIIRFLENTINYHVKEFEENHPKNILTKAVFYLRIFSPQGSMLHAFIKN